MAGANNYKNQSKNKIDLEYGKVPPQAVELEEAVLGALMLEKDAIISVGDLLKVDSFYKDAHQKIYKAIMNLSTKEEPIDILTVTEELKREGTLDEVGGPFYITQLTNRVASAAHIEFHARIIAQKHIQRELIRVSSDIQNQAFDDSIDVADLLDKAQQEVFDIAEGNIKKESAHIRPLADEVINQIVEAGKRPDGLSGVPSGFTALDRITSGWQKSDLVIIAARPSMGKTAFVLSMTRNMAVEHKAPIAIFSLEMGGDQLVKRMISSETELGSEKLRNGKLEDFEWEQLHVKIKDLVDAPIYVDDTPGLSIYELRSKCRRLKAKYDIGCVIIDYLQLMTAGSDMRGNREQEVSLISRQLKIIAKELNIPVIALSQLNRGVEQRTGDAKKPMLSDLRESGAIEQDADMVLFIHRPERYGITEDAEGNSLIGIADIIIAKHRNGAVGEIQLRFRNQLARFMDLEGESLNPFGDDGPEEVKTFSSSMNQDSGGFEDPNAGLVGGSDFEDAAPF
ncbi:replicative DNA helicase [Marinifilum caeruleilacunae]|uniref:Replicative DNA helicase n=1 Tax=Marinifilum caeruleilacunae TaxID=2499076 RepID=A0ABX1X166_9BACT|nr:replicative DNA helicase [Marinifilum caeruleilacunae]NOU61876.1 replicative DNA helicase [Marinifilum caeruleilacunae]